VRAFRCRVCDNHLYFESSRCLSCGSGLGYARAERAVVPVDDTGRYVDSDGATWWVCGNAGLLGCTWLAAVEGAPCFACSLTRTRPDGWDRPDGGHDLTELRRAEQAKRHLVHELDSLGLPVRGRNEDPEEGLAFDLLSSDGGNDVTIGHADGIVTIDLAESDDAYRERVRARLDEPYRTMLGHFRHEVGHYFEWQLVRGELVDRCRELFGDEREPYADALARHYEEGAPADWSERFISTYATMHPFEDFAETFAHYLHIADTIESAGEHGLTTVAPLSAFSHFSDVVAGVWMPLSTALNVINRSMGRDDLYPFVIAPPVLDKLDFVASLAPGRLAMASPG
jgi:hypothetical protein